MAGNDEKEASVIGPIIESIATYIPPANAVLTGVNSYHLQQLELHIIDLDRRIKKLTEIPDKAKTFQWYRTPDGRGFGTKAFGVFIDPKQIDKLEFVSSTLLRGPLVNLDILQKLKFLDMISQMSRAALLVVINAVDLAKAGKVPRQGPVKKHLLAKELSQDVSFIGSCIYELQSLGISANDKTSDQLKVSEGIATGDGLIITDFTLKFADFINEYIVNRPVEE